MWLVEYYGVIHRVAWYLSITVSVVVLFFLVAAITVRVWRDRMDQRHRRLLKRWKKRFAAGLEGSTAEDGTPSDRKPGDAPFVEQRLALRAWLERLDESTPEEQTRLVRLGRDMGLGGVALKHLSGTLEDQLLACRVLGYVHGTDREEARRSSREKLEYFRNDANPYLSLAAHEALIRRDPRRYLPEFLADLRESRGVHHHMAARMFERLDDVDLSDPMVTFMREADLADQAWMILLLTFADPKDYRGFLGEILDASDHEELRARALRLVRRTGGTEHKRRVLDALEDEAWFVRLQAAITLGAIGGPEDAPALVPLLEDREWWVRCRAAQALRRLSESTTDDLKKLRGEMTDDYARDILTQVMAE